MDHKQELQKTLEAIKGIDKVYYKPTVNTKMEYPCIKFDRSGRPSEFANNKRYIVHDQFTIIYISRASQKDILSVIEQIEEIPFVIFDRHYVADGLEHYVYTKTY